MKRIFFLLLLLPSLMSAQYVVRVNNHEIITNDSIADATLKEFFYEVDHARVDYLTDLRKLKEVRFIEADKTFIGSQKDGVLTLNKYLDDYPNTKRIVVLHLLGKFYGLKGTPGSSYRVMNENFIMNARTEYFYRNRRTLRLDIKDLVKQLEEHKPLNTLVDKKRK